MHRLREIESKAIVNAIKTDKKSREEEKNECVVRLMVHSFVDSIWSRCDWPIYAIVAHTLAFRS